MSPLNPNQARRVVSTFAHVDSLLRTIERVARADLSPFSRERADVASDEARLLQSFVSLARARMLAALDRLGIPRPQPSSSARWSVQTTLTFADIALSELGPGDLAGYGAVDQAAATELEALSTDLRGIVERARHVLHEQDPGGLTMRIKEIPGTVGDVLREVEIVSREHALAEIRPLLAAAAERAVSTTFDVGVFGRVSAGKSSLINALIAESVLPVGATPVTAVPIRLTRGESAAVLHLLDGGRREISIGDIAEYATEEGNPENRTGIRAIDISVPSVPDGLRLLDTPGVGSMGASGPAMAFAWLPRCDLGIVLIAAGTAVGRDDLALVTGLRQAGIRCVVLLSKSDLLCAAELEGALSYVRRELDTAAGSVSAARSMDDAALEVHAVSTAPGYDAQLEHFRREILAPLAHDHAAEARAALVGRMHRLVYAAAMALDARGANGADADGAAGVASEASLRVQRARAAALAALRNETDRVGNAAGAVLETSTDAVLSSWEAGRDARSAVRATIIQAAGDALGAVRELIDYARETAGVAAADQRRMPPLFDPEFLDAIPPLPPPAMARKLFGRTLAKHRLESLAEPLGRSLQRYANNLYGWGNGAIDELGGLSWEAVPASSAASETAPERDGASGEESRAGSVASASRESPLPAVLAAAGRALARLDVDAAHDSAGNSRDVHAGQEGTTPVAT